MSVSVAELMAPNVIIARDDETVAEIRERMLAHEVHALPVVDSANRPAGIVTSSDLVEAFDADSPVSTVMTRQLQCIDLEAPARLAARVMRNHRLHHLLVTQGDELVGILSAFDLLRLVDEPEKEAPSVG